MGPLYCLASEVTPIKFGNVDRFHALVKYKSVNHLLALSEFSLVIIFERVLRLDTPCSLKEKEGRDKFKLFYEGSIEIILRLTLIMLYFASVFFIGAKSGDYFSLFSLWSAYTVRMKKYHIV